MPQPTEHSPAPVLLYQLAPLFLCTAGWGLVTVMLGPLLPTLIARWHIQDAQAGTLFTASFAGQLLGAWFATRNLRLSLLSGAVLSAVGTAALAWTNFSGAHLAFFAAGLGIGAGLAAGNVVAGNSTSDRARALAIFNVSWSVGAIACPALIHLSGTSHPHLFFFVTATLVLLGGLLVATLPSSLTEHPPSSANPLQRSPLPLPAISLALFGLSMLLYIGNENTLGGWLPSFAVRNSPAIQASTIALLYWLSELISRLAMAAILYRVVSETTLYRAGLALLLLTQVALIVLPHPAPSVVLIATLLNGAALGPLYPLIIAFLLARTGNHPGLGPLFASASLGGATLPWLTGLFSTHFGGLRFGLLVPVAGTIVMLLFSAGIVPEKRPV